ncbi:hypothetical protein RJT34_16001 [Clitoria ternatea]|uniref:F-box domain-containing protein n=1 Tax=Clitoria ternatea TaxID=43366 RepID=A0AAN9J6E7_CLITE
MRRQEDAVLSEDVLIEILSWLPVTTLVGFKCVSKSWNSLISDPHFQKLHIQRSSVDSTNLRLLLENKFDQDQGGFSNTTSLSSWSVTRLLGNPSPIPLIRPSFTQHYSVIGSCNGLIALHAESPPLVYPYKTLVYFWNPATREISPESPSYDSSTKFNNFGFGYDHTSDAYKVVVLFPGKVHSMGANCWTDIQTLPDDQYQVHMYGVYLSDTLNWIALRKSGDYVKMFVIVSLHLGKESYAELPLPDPLQDHDPCIWHLPILCVSRGCLCVSCYHMDTHFVIWQMKELGLKKSWTCLVNINLEYVETCYPGIEFLSFTMCLFQNGDVLLLATQAYTQFCSVLFNQRDGILKVVEIPSVLSVYNAWNYVESLVSPI